MAAYVTVSGEAVLTCRCALGPVISLVGLLLCAMHVRSCIDGWYPTPARRNGRRGGVILIVSRFARVLLCMSSMPLCV